MHTASVNARFQRRADISIKDRVLIAYLHKYQNTWGLVKRLTDKYNVSRQFIYNTSDIFSTHFEQAFDKHELSENADKSLETILSYRMDGKCSIPDISVLLQRFGLKNTSVGFISEHLTAIGKAVGNKLDLPELERFTFSICSDEVFSNGRPILISVDPKNLLILNIELAEKRDAATWIAHFQQIKELGVNVSQLIKDEGAGLKAAQQAELSDIEVQSDTFHAVAHRLGLFVNRFLIKAYKRIGDEFEYERLFMNAKSDKYSKKCYQNYWQAVAQSKKAIELYENFKFLYHCLLECFQLFNKDGDLKDKSKVIDDFDTALELLSSLNISKVEDEIKHIKKCKSDLFTFYHSAKNIHTALSESIDIELLKPLCLAWQCKKNQINSKNTNRTAWFENKEIRLLSYVKDQNEGDYTAIKETVYQQLGNIIQSSAAVECVNSLLRPYLNTMKGKVTQEFLNLFMFYHNHHQFKSGLRKGKSPFQMATNTKKHIDWVELIQQRVA